ncbi:MAG: GNAT family N-acetyltransferase, partial [Betaproteobacteria bacterium]
MGAPVSQVEVKQATSAEDFAVAKTLIEHYAAELNVDLCFQDFAEEIADLSGMYGPPGGCLLLASAGGEVVGCVAVRKLDAGSCEMKRLYVQPQHRAAGVGRRLAEIAIATAAELGYTQMMLDTLPDMNEAQAIYASLGFEEIAGYYPNPLPGVRYLVCRLGGDKPDS